jgi:hypothetical protein
MREANLDTDTSPHPTPSLHRRSRRCPGMEENGPEAAPEQPPDHRPSRRASRFQTAPTTTETVQPALEDWQPAEEVQAFCQLLVVFRTSLSQGMQSILSNLSHAPLRPGLEGLASTALTALLGLEKSLQPLCPSSAPVDLIAPSAADPVLSRRRISWGRSHPLSPVAAGGHPYAGSPALSRSSCSKSSQLGEGGGQQHSSFPPDGSSGQQLERVDAGPETPQSRADAADSCGVGCNLLLHLDSFGQPWSDAPPWSPGNQWSQFPSRREERGRDGQPICEGAPSSTDRPFLPGRADSGSPEVTVCHPALRSSRDGHGGRRSPHRPDSEAAGRTSNLPPSELPELLRRSTQGAEGRLAPLATSFLAGGLPSSPPGHLAYECHLSGDFLPEAQLSLYREI